MATAKGKAPTAAQIARAKQVLRRAGITKAALAKTTGTTKKEVTASFNKSARRLAAGKAAPLRAVRKELYGGKAAGVAKNPKRVAAANKATTQAKMAYGWKPPKGMRKQPRIAGGQ